MNRARFYADGKAVRKKHDEIVQSLASLFEGNKVIFPDRAGRVNEVAPDISIDDKLVIEVKVLNPTIEDHEVDSRAQLEWRQKGQANYGGTMNTRALQADIEKAVEQLANRSEQYKLVVLYSPLKWQLNRNRLAHMLTGLDTLMLYMRGTKLMASDWKKTGVPLKRGIEDRIDGVMFINEASFNNRTLWKLNEKDNQLLKLLKAENIDFWKERRERRLM